MADEQYYAGAKIPFDFELDTAVDNIVINAVKYPSVVIAKYAYPAKEGYTSLTKVDNTYSGVLLDTDTSDIAAGKLQLEAKTWIGSNWAPIGIIPISAIIANTVGQEEKW